MVLSDPGGGVGGVSTNHETLEVYSAIDGRTFTDVTWQVFHLIS